MKENLKKYLTEVVGTFFLVLTVFCCSFNSLGIAAPFAIATVLAAMVYAGGHISGGHYNPAVSLAACIRGALPVKQFIPYIIAQFLGGVVAVFTFYFLVGEKTVFVPADFNTCQLLVAEILFTFALCYVVLQTATVKKTEGNSYFGFAIGITVLAGALSVGGTFCSGAFNPAVALSAGIANALSWKLAGYTMLANVIGGILAAIIFKLTCTEEK